MVIWEFDLILIDKYSFREGYFMVQEETTSKLGMFNLDGKSVPCFFFIGIFNWIKIKK